MVEISLRRLPVSDFHGPAHGNTEGQPRRGERRAPNRPDGQRYSARSASRTCMRAPRRAGTTAAMTPTMTASKRNTPSWRSGGSKPSPRSSSELVTSSANSNPDRRTEQPTDHRGDDALVADHLPHLSLRCADGTQQSELARPLVDREEERVRDPEQGDHDAHRKQRVEQVHELVELTADRVGILGLRLDRRGRECPRVRRSGAASRRQRPRRRAWRRRSSTGRGQRTLGRTAPAGRSSPGAAEGRGTRRWP